MVRVPPHHLLGNVDEPNAIPRHVPIVFEPGFACVQKLDSTDWPMPWKYALDWPEIAHYMERFDPTVRMIGVRDVMVRSGKNQVAHHNGPLRRNIERGSVDRLANGQIDETNLFSLKKSAAARQRFGHGQRPRHFVAEHFAPMDNLRAIFLHKIDHASARVDRSRRKSLLHDSVSEIMVGMSVGDVNGLQRLPCRSNHGHEARRIAKNEARINEYRVSLACNQDGIVRKCEVLSREDLKSEGPLGGVSFGHRIRRMRGLERRKNSAGGRRGRCFLVAGGVFSRRQNADEASFAALIFEENHAIHTGE